MNKSLNWKTFVVTIIGIIIAIGAWVFPEPLGGSIAPPTSTPVLSSFGSGGLVNASLQPKPGKIRILIARFDEEDQTNYRVTDLIVAKLRESTSSYSDTEIVVVDQVITELQGSELAKEIGETYGASIVIWGWYGLTDQVIPLGVHFEIISSASPFQPITCAVSTSQVRKVNLTEINDLTLQTTLSNELSYVTLFTLGLIRFEAQDYEKAIELFDNALKYLDENTQLTAKTSGDEALVDQNILYLYRGISYVETEKYDQALVAFEYLVDQFPEDTTARSLLAYLYAKQNKFSEASEQYSIILNKETDGQLRAIAYYSRGVAYEKMGDFVKANEDYNQAGEIDDYIVYYYSDPSIPLENSSLNDSIEEIDANILKNPSNPLSYYLRAIVRYRNISQSYDSGTYSLNTKSEDFNKAIRDLEKTIELNPRILGAHNLLARLLARSEIYNPHETIRHFSISFESKKYRTPCDTQNRGVAYADIDDNENARLDFEEVVRLTTIAIERDPRNANAYYVRGLAYSSLDDYYQAFRQYWQVQRLDPSMARRLQLQSKMLDILGNYRNYFLITIGAIALVIFGINFAPKIKTMFKQMQLKYKQPKRRHRKH